MFKLIVDNEEFKYDYYSANEIDDDIVYTFNKTELIQNDLLSIKTKKAELFLENKNILENKKYTIQKSINYEKNNFQVVKIQIRILQEGI